MIGPLEVAAPLLRPFSLVIPFTVQTGEITGQSVWLQPPVGGAAFLLLTQPPPPLAGEVRMPSGRTAPPQVADNKDGTVTVRFSPSERGLHEMHIKYDGNHIPGTSRGRHSIVLMMTSRFYGSSGVEGGRSLVVLLVVRLSVFFHNGFDSAPPHPDPAHPPAPLSTGSPLQFFVDAINSRHVTAFGPGLSHGTAHRAATFTIVTKDAGEGTPPPRPPTPPLPWLFGLLVAWLADGCVGAGPAAGGLSLAVEGPSKAEISCQDNQDGSCTVSYLPTAPGDYSIIVRFDEHHIPGSPFTARITGTEEVSRAAPALSVGTSSDVSLQIAETELSGLAASIRAPSGLEEPCLLKRLPNRHIGGWPRPHRCPPQARRSD